jgi:hypothetical protein
MTQDHRSGRDAVAGRRRAQSPGDFRRVRSNLIRLMQMGVAIGGWRVSTGDWSFTDGKKQSPLAGATQIQAVRSDQLFQGRLGHEHHAARPRAGDHARTLRLAPSQKDRARHHPPRATGQRGRLRPSGGGEVADRLRKPSSWRSRNRRSNRRKRRPRPEAETRRSRRSRPALRPAVHKKARPSSNGGQPRHSRNRGKLWHFTRFSFTPSPPPPTR